MKRLTLLALIVSFLTLLSAASLANAVCANIPTFNESTAINSDLIAYFHFNNQSQYGETNSLVCDFSGNRNDGTIYQAKWNASGGKYNDGAFEFNGKSSYIRIRDADKLSPNKTGGYFTIAFFVKFNTKNFTGEGSSKDYVNFLGKGDSANGYEWMFREHNASAVDRQNRLSFYAFNLTGGDGAKSYVQENFNANEWTHIIGAINRTHIKIYKNGALKSTNTLSEYNIQLTHSHSNLYIGNTGDSSQFIGAIDKLRVYNYALSDLEVKTLYAQYNLT